MVALEVSGGSSMNISTAVVPLGHVAPPLPLEPPLPLAAPLPPAPPLPADPPAPPPPHPEIGVCVTPWTGSQASVVQALPSSTCGGVPALQKPLWHDSSPLHSVLSGHG